MSTPEIKAQLDALYAQDLASNAEPQPTQVPGWPAGVIARYLTVGGSTVDISFVEGARGKCEADCLGCGASDWIDTSNIPIHDEEAARGWAQDHASVCRAMPRPTP